MDNNTTHRERVMDYAYLKTNRITSGLIAAWLLATSLPAHTGEMPAVGVEILKYQFIPQEITIPAGTTVRWSNKEKRQYHSVWFEQAGDPEPGYFFPGETYERTFDTPGVYPYHCGPHPEMTGTVRVE
jgi:plastocyanin